MTSVLLCVGAFLVCLLGGNRSLKLGLFAIIAVGYVYGILRANLPDLWTYLMFDAGVIGLYCAQLWRPLTQQQRVAAQDLRLWLVALIAWPTLLFILSPSPEPLVELVGLRANIFLLPFLLLGARLSYDDVEDMAVYLACLNLGAVGLATLEFFIGLAPFFPVNEVTEIIYKSKDLVGRTAYRIPSSFSSAHAFAGTMVMTLPLLVGAWCQHRGERWRTTVLVAAIVASLVGIFMAAARTHMITAVLLVGMVTLSGQLRGRLWVKWALVVGLVGYVIAGDARFQRFMTLQDTDQVTERLAGSVNEGFFDLVGEHPLGRGLASGGTSVPYFLREHAEEGPVMENEYARIGLEQGLPGLALWVMFIAWVMTRRPARVRDNWMLARQLAWMTCAVVFASGLLGMGMLSSVPQTILMLMSVGWFVVARRRPVEVTAPLPLPDRAMSAPAQ